MISSGQNNSLGAIQKKLIDQGIKILPRLIRQCKDWESREKITQEELIAVLKLSNTNITDDEAQILAQQAVFHSAGEGITPSLVLKLLSVFFLLPQGQPNARRQSMIDKAYLKLEKDCCGFVSVFNIRNTYNAALHPHVQAHRMTEENATLEFLENFPNSICDGLVTKEVCHI